MASFTLADLAKKLDAKLSGDGAITISTIASMTNAKPGQISFLSNSSFREQLGACQASAVVLTEADLTAWHGAALIVADPYLCYAKLAQILDTTPKPANEIAPSAVLAADVVLGKNVAIGANAVIESGVNLGDNVTVGAGCFVGRNARIGANTQLWANVTIYHEVVIGQSCLIQAGAVIGSDGFGYANDRGKWIKIPQLGTVILGDNVEIGACTTIDRGALDNTVINNGVIIDNQCQIAHNVTIGANTAVAGGVIMAGSLKVGAYCLIGGASVLNGHMEICDKVQITGMAMVMRPITEPGIYSSGIPLQPNKAWRKTAATVLKIDEMNKRLRKIERQIEEKN